MFRFALLAPLLLVFACGGPSGPIVLQHGDVTLRTLDDGSFDLSVSGRPLLSGRPGPVELRHTHVDATMQWGLFDFDASVSSMSHRKMKVVNSYK